MFKRTLGYKQYKHELNARLERTIKQYCHKLRNNVTKALSKQGAVKELDKAFGKGRHDYAKGQQDLFNLKETKRKDGSVIYAWGGTLATKKGNFDRIYWHAGKHKWAQASPVGTPPFKQTGFLATRIGTEFSSAGLSGRVGPLDEVVYARRHELGGPGTYPARPYLKPEFEKLKGEIEAAIKKAVVS